MTSRRGLLTALLICLATPLTTSSPAETASRYVVQGAGRTKVIIFMHGVVGDADTTWTHATTKAYWPPLVAQDPAFRHSNVYVFEYPSPPLGRTFSINELAETLRRRLEADGVLAHPELIFLSHSMGGLVTRAFLVKYREHAEKVKSLYFAATPTEGSPMAALASAISRSPQFRNLYPMSSDSYLADLQRDWLAARLGIRSFCASERKDTFGVLVVDQRSASNLCTEPLDPILENHIDVVKPRDRDADIYIAFKNAYAAVLRDGNVIPHATRTKLDHPLIDPDRPLRDQVQLFAEDKVRIFGPESLRRVRFGGPWELFNPSRTYIVIGVPGRPVTPDFDPMPRLHFKIEVEYNKYVDFPRDLNSPEADVRRDLRSVPKH